MRRWGHFVYRHRTAVLLVSLTSFVLSIAGLLTGGQPINASNYDVESVRAANLESAQLPSTTGSSFTLILSSSHRTFGEPAFETAVNAAVAPLRPRSTKGAALRAGLDTWHAKAEGNAIVPNPRAMVFRKLRRSSVLFIVDSLIFLHTGRG